MHKIKNLTLIILLIITVVNNKCYSQILNSLEEFKFYEVTIKGGTFIKPENDGIHNEKTEVSNLIVSKCHITEGLYNEILGFYGRYIINDYEYKYGWYRLPANGEKEAPTWVSYIDIIKFCNKLSIYFDLEKVYYFRDDGRYFADLRKNGYRLPTEEEWKYLATSGGRTVLYYNGIFNGVISDMPGNKQKIVYKNMSLNEPNYYGIYDISTGKKEICGVDQFYTHPWKYGHHTVLYYEFIDDNKIIYKTNSCMYENRRLTKAGFRVVRKYQ